MAYLRGVSPSRIPSPVFQTGKPRVESPSARVLELESEKADLEQKLDKALSQVKKLQEENKAIRQMLPLADRTREIPTDKQLNRFLASIELSRFVREIDTGESIFDEKMPELPADLDVTIAEVKEQLELAEFEKLEKLVNEEKL